MAKVKRLKCKFFNIEGASMEIESNNDDEGRISFIFLLATGLKGYGFKKKNESFNQMFRRAEKEYRALEKRSKE